MCVEVGTLVEAFAADVALMRWLFVVYDLMYGERSRLTETFAAGCALEGLFFRMNVPERRKR